MKWKTFPEKEVQNQIKKLEQFHFVVRTTFRYVRERDYGKRSISMRSENFTNPFKSTIEFDRPIDEQTRNQINQLSHYMNQNIIIRLCALLEYYGLIKSIDKDLSGWEEVDILRRLRHYFAHTTGRFNPNERKEQVLWNKMIDKFGIERKDVLPGEYPLSKDKVLMPIFEGCKSYVHDFYSKNSPSYVAQDSHERKAYPE